MIRGGSELSLLQNKFEGMDEDMLSKTVVVPLMKAMGYKAEFHGGQYEHGKDIVSWIEDPFGSIECCVAQVKKLRPVVSTRQNSSFSDLVNQLQEASEKEVPCIDGKMHIPKRVLFITPYDVDTRALTTRFEKYRELNSRGVQIIDGTKLANLLNKYCPDVVETLLGRESAISRVTLEHLSNDALMHALRANTGRNIEGYYCDLEFELGKKTNRLFQLFLQEKYPNQIKVNSRELEAILKVDKLIQEKAAVNLLTQKPETYQKTKKLYYADLARKAQTHVVTEEGAKIKMISHLKAKTSSPWETVFDSAMRQFNEIAARIEKSLNKNKDEFVELPQKLIRENELLQKQYSKEGKLEEAQKNIGAIAREMDKRRVLQKRFSQELMTSAYFILFLVEDYHRYVRTHDDFLCDIQLNTDGFVAWLNGQRRWLRDSIDCVNKKTMSISKLNNFLSRAQNVVAVCDDILNVPIMDRVLMANSQDPAIGRTSAMILPAARLTTMPVVHLPIYNFFDTKLNFAVFGDAGAGKTTTLQMYGKRLIDREDDRLTLFVPLVSAMNVYKRRNPDYAISQAEPVTLLLQSIAAFLSRDATSPVSSADLQSILAGKGCTLLLDGVDEVVSDNPWIVEAIAELCNRFHTSQVITSSRQSGSYRGKMPCFGVTMREFTPQQRNHFIEAWFLAGEDKTIAEGLAKRVIQHLEKNHRIAEVIRNPLNATIMCVLAESKMPLPECEIQLYRDRLRLLFGEFDRQKDVRRIASHPDFLERVAVKLAYFLHSHDLRHESLANLRSEAVRLFEGKATQEATLLAVTELVDPCNVLVPMNQDGEFGFGHLRFQEYLVALELQSNRNIVLTDLLYKDWWRGAMVLLAQMNDDLEFIFAHAIDHTRLSAALQTINEMVKDKPDSYIERIDKWLAERCSVKRGSVEDQEDDDVTNDETLDESEPATL